MPRRHDSYTDFKAGLTFVKIFLAPSHNSSTIQFMPQNFAFFVEQNNKIIDVFPVFGTATEFVATMLKNKTFSSKDKIAIQYRKITADESKSLIVDDL